MPEPTMPGMRTRPEYEEGRSYYLSRMSMSDSNGCHYPIGSGDKRTAWMLGFFDAYFQALCDRRNWGPWLAKAVTA